VVWVGSKGSLVTSWGGELNERAVLLAVDVEVYELSVGGESGAEGIGLNGLSHVANVTHRALLLERGGDGLWALALGICASSLPALGLGSLILLVGSWGGGGWDWCWCGSCSWSSGGGRCALLGWGRRGGLGGWDGRNDGAGASSNGSSRGAVGPAHGLGWSGWDRGSLGSSNLSGSWAWERIFGDLGGLGCLLLKLLLGDLRSHGRWGGGSLLDGLSSTSRSSAVGLGLFEDSGLGILLKLLLNDICDDLRLCLLDGGLGLGHLDIGSLLSGGGSGLVVGNSLDDLLLSLLVDVAEDVVEDEVSGRLLGEDESLDELLQLGRLVGCLANDLDDDGLVRALGVDVRDADLAVLELKRLDALLDGLD
jgi:hypothetical protein